MRTPHVNTRRRGGGALEAALVLPVLLIILMGLVETGWMFLGQQVVTRAVQDGCRAGAMAPSPEDPASAAADAINEALVGSGYTCPSGGCDPEVTLAWSAGERYIACSLTTPHEPLTALIPGMDAVQLTSATRNRVERTD
jgi:Flp pilus assembly protein TadG